MKKYENLPLRQPDRKEIIKITSLFTNIVSPLAVLNDETLAQQHKYSRES